MNRPHDKGKLMNNYLKISPTRGTFLFNFTPEEETNIYLKISPTRGTFFNFSGFFPSMNRPHGKGKLMNNYLKISPKWDFFCSILRQKEKQKKKLKKYVKYKMGKILRKKFTLKNGGGNGCHFGFLLD